MSLFNPSQDSQYVTEKELTDKLKKYSTKSYVTSAIVPLQSQTNNLVSGVSVTTNQVELKKPLTLIDGDINVNSPNHYMLDGQALNLQGVSTATPNTLVLRDSSANFAANSIDTNQVTSTTGNIEVKSTSGLVYLSPVSSNPLIVMNQGSSSGGVTINASTNAIISTAGDLTLDTVGHVISNSSATASNHVVNKGSMDSAITVETNRATTAETNLQNSINSLSINLSNAISSEVNRASSAENTITTNLNSVTTTVNNATSNGTANTIVKRDNSGNFSAGTITANLSGNASTVTTIPTLSGDVTNTANNVTVNNSAVIGKVLTGYTSGAGTISATDSILSAIQKLNGNDATNAPMTGEATSTGTTNVVTLTNSAVIGKVLTGINTSVAFSNIVATDSIVQMAGKTGNLLNFATNLNTASTLVKRDTNGNINAGYITNNALLGSAEQTRYESVTLPTSSTTNNCIEFAQITSVNGGGSISLGYCVDSTSNATGSRYQFPITNNGTSGVWNRLIPYNRPSYTDVCELEIKISSLITTLRLRRTSGTVAGTALIALSLNINSGSTYASISNVTTDTTTAPFYNDGRFLYTQNYYTPLAQGSYLTWNRSSTGMTAFANQQGGGTGGFEWLNYNNSNVLSPSSPLMSLDGSGNLTVLGNITAPNVSGTALATASTLMARDSNADTAIRDLTFRYLKNNAGTISLDCNTGNSNVFLQGGNQTGTSTNGNVCIATGAGAALTGGNNSNVFIGLSAGNRTTQGSANIAIGNSSLFLNQLGATNTVCGSHAMITANGNTNNDNCAYGSQAGQGNGSANYHQTGGSCTYIGANTGQSSGTFNNCTALGQGAIATGDNTIQLGNSAVVAVNTPATISCLAVNASTNITCGQISCSGVIQAGNLISNGFLTASGGIVSNGDIVLGPNKDIYTSSVSISGQWQGCFFPINCFVRFIQRGITVTMSMKEIGSDFLAVTGSTTHGQYSSPVPSGYIPASSLYGSTFSAPFPLLDLSNNCYYTATLFIDTSSGVITLFQANQDLPYGNFPSGGVYYSFSGQSFSWEVA